MVAKDTADKDPNVVVNEMRLDAGVCIPATGARLKPGTTTIEGCAIAMQNGVAKVQPSIDGGRNWHAAAIEKRTESRRAWVLDIIESQAS